MRKFILLIILFFTFISFASAQFQYSGPTIKHRDTVSSVDTWFITAQTAPRTGSEELKGYNSVRIAADISNGATVIINLAVSNDSLWISGDSLTFTRDSYQDVILQGGSDYYVNVDSISAGTVTVYLTPFRQ